MRHIIIALSTLLLTASHAQFGPQHFAFQSDLFYPNSVFTGDMDGDGDLDVVSRDYLYDGTSNSILLWYANNGTGEFADKQVLFIGELTTGQPFRMVDLDGDADADLIVGTQWFRNNGPGTFVPVGTYLPPNTSGSQLFADLDGDGDIDDVGRTATNAVLLLNNGAGVFSVGPSIGPTGASTTITASLGDFDGDTDLDLMIGGNNAQVGWYAHTGGTSYGPQQNIDLFTAPAIPVCGDMDGDGDADVMALGVAPGMRWFENDGAGNFTVNDTISTSTSIPQVVADLDGDGDLDYTVETGTSCNVTIARNAGSGAWPNVNVEYFGAYSLQHTKYAVGDLNGDGNLDIAFCHGQGIIGWYATQTDGTWSPRRRVSRTISYCQDVVAVDVDGDDDNDLVAASYHADMVTLYRNTGDGTFAQQEILAENFDGVNDMEAFDVDSDGDVDVIASSGGKAVLFLNNGDGSAWSQQVITGAGGALSIADLNNDNYTDLICGAKWYSNDGDGLFTEVAVLTTGTGNKVGDVNGDGIVDVVYVLNTGGITAQINDGAGNFTAVNSPSISYIGDMALADLDGDNDLDIATVAYAPPMVWYRNDGVGNFTQETLLELPPAGGRAITCADLDGDGDQDILWARSEGYTHQSYFLMNQGGGVFGINAYIDPSAELTARMVLADVNGDEVPDLINARFNSLSWMENLFFDVYRLRGSVFYDFDQDATLDSEELKVPYQLVRSNGEQTLVWTNSAGNYDLPALEGTWDVWTSVPFIYAVSNEPDTLTATLTAAQPIASNLDFGLVPAVQNESSFVSFTTNDFFRCNTEVGTWLQLRNTGTLIPEDIVIDLQIHPDLAISYTSVPPDSIVGDHYYWSCDSLGWFQEKTIYIGILVGPVGSGASITATVTSPDIDEPVVQSIGGPVTCAFDPNDKLVTPQGYGAAGAVDIDTDWLTYTIRFQNTGTDTALSVVLTDYLDLDLDPESMQILGASHPLTQIMVEAEQRAMFRFDNIMLPDSGADQLASNGFVKYRIKTRVNLPHLTTIINQASIYFDFNIPVLTNTVLNTLVDCGLHVAEVDEPDATHLVASEGANYQWFLNDEPLINATSASYTAMVSGFYSVRITTVYGCEDLSDPYQVVMTGMLGTGAMEVGLMPNPFTDCTTLISNERLTTDHTVELVDLTGKVVRRQLGNGSGQLIIARNGLSAGMYMVRIIGGEGTLAVRRVVLE